MRRTSRASGQLSFGFDELEVGPSAPAVTLAPSGAPAPPRPAPPPPRAITAAPARSVAAAREARPPVRGETRAWTLRARPGVLVDVREAQRLATDLSRHMREPIRVVLTDNRRTMISVGRRAARVEIRLHHMFLEADALTVEAIARYVASRGRSEAAVIDTFVRDRRDRIRDPEPRVDTLRTAGAHHDLGELFEEIVEDYFDVLSEEDFRATFGEADIADVRLTWGHARKRRKGQRSLQLGTYVSSKNLIRIHPVLDQEWVPAFYVASVLFHELLHHLIPPEIQGDRMVYHSVRFRRAEAAYEHYEAAQAWEREHLAKLLRSLPK